MEFRAKFDPVKRDFTYEADDLAFLNEQARTWDENQ